MPMTQVDSCSSIKAGPSIVTPGSSDAAVCSSQFDGIAHRILVFRRGRCSTMGRNNAGDTAPCAEFRLVYR
jgi:hypothetical protein